MFVFIVSFSIVWRTCKSMVYAFVLHLFKSFKTIYVIYFINFHLKNYLLQFRFVIAYSQILNLSLGAPTYTRFVKIPVLVFQELKNTFHFFPFKNQKAPFIVIALLGLIFNSALFPNRSPADYVSGTAFLGGNFINESQIEIENIVKKDLLKIFSSLNENSIEIKFIKSWVRGIPQYNLGHSALITKVKNQLPDSIKLVGNYLTGISLEETIKSTF